MVIEDITSFMKIIIKNQLINKKNLWYRGQSKFTWKLIPLLLRNDKYNEMELIKIFKQNATLLLNPRPVNPHEWLFVMRHYNFPTRLLDWTENPLVALYFAVCEKSSDDGAFWILNPLQLNEEGSRKMTHPNVLPTFEEDSFMRSYSPENYAVDNVTQMLPISFLAPRNTARMQAQLSVFTIHHRDNTPIEEIDQKNHTLKFLIPKKSKKSILSELELLKIDRFQLFPELNSLSYKIQEKK